jgi:hypothetical protein
MIAAAVLFLPQILSRMPKTITHHRGEVNKIDSPAPRFDLIDITTPTPPSKEGNRPQARSGGEERIENPRWGFSSVSDLMLRALLGARKFIFQHYLALTNKKGLYRIKHRFPKK